MGGSSGSRTCGFSCRNPGLDPWQDLTSPAPQGVSQDTSQEPSGNTRSGPEDPPTLHPWTVSLRHLVWWLSWTWVGMTSLSPCKCLWHRKWPGLWWPALASTTSNDLRVTLGLAIRKSDSGFRTFSIPALTTNWGSEEKVFFFLFEGKRRSRVTFLDSWPTGSWLRRIRSCWDPVVWGQQGWRGLQGCTCWYWETSRCLGLNLDWLQARPVP